MKFTSKDLARAMDLKVGDRIKFYTANCVCVIDKNYQLYDERAKVSLGSIAYLINEEFEILPPKKKVGELRCKNFKYCNGCPLKCVLCMSVIDSSKDKLYDILEKFNAKYHDQEIYDIMKKRLDKVVEEDE